MASRTAHRHQGRQDGEWRITQGRERINPFCCIENVFVSASARYESDRRTSTQAFLADGSLNPFDVQDATTKLDLRVGFASPDDRWALELWGKNITDEITRSVTFNTPLNVGARGAFVQDPATYGVTLRVKH